MLVVNLIGHCTFEQSMDATAIRMAGNHGIKIVTFVNPAPIYAHLHALLEYHVQPDARRTAIALHKRMSRIHLYVLLYNLVESRLWHRLYGFQVAVQMLCQTKQSIPLSDGFRTNLASEVI